MAMVDFFENGLCFHCHLAKSELCDYVDFHRITERAWTREDEALQRDLDSIIARYPESQRNDIIETHAWDLHVRQIKFPDIHRRSLVITLVAFVEQHLNDMCAIIADVTRTSAALENAEGRGIKRALHYLRDHAEFQLGTIASLQFVYRVQELRNKLVHAAGCLPTDSASKLNSFVAQEDTLSGEPGSSVIIADGFIEHAAKRLAQFFEELDSQVKEFIRRCEVVQQEEGTSNT
jgi:hypothetical protein